MDAEHQIQAVNSYTSEYIKFADAKAGLVLTFVSIVGALTGVAAPRILETARTVHWIVFALGIVLGGATAVSVLMVLWHTMAAIAPRVPRASQSLASFPDIAELDPNEYIKRALAVSSPDAAREYAIHNVILARIAMAKFGSIAKAMIWARRSVFASYGLVLVHVITHVAQ